ncbi:AGAP011225-PA-like protein [Anopheles sinensis]|uniref:AGAP011225-PA-like protein n=1 Tax=Anopheles sinensis TaxID=74873 RepID=A0A084VKN7_ANOSI|nr:AGAP011225-PA-like protein [Anopheles sinensis]
MYAIEETLKQSVKTSEDNTREKLEDLRNHVISKMDSIVQQQVAETKTIQETTQVELMKLMPLIKLVPLRSCRQAPKNESDKYMIKPGINTQPFEVLCEQTKFGGGWTVIQHRFDGSVDFRRKWTEYRNGFGKLDGEFWLGLEYVHQLTKNRPHELLVEIKDFHGNYGYAKYDEFEIGSETESYALKKLGTYTGTAGDSMLINWDEKFSTFDRDNNYWRCSNCAENQFGAWWGWHLSNSNLNGRYQNTTGDASAMYWNHSKNDHGGLSYSRMMIRDIN